MQDIAAVSKSDLFDDLRAGFKTVADHARFVKINHDRLAECAASLPDAPPENVLDPDHHFRGDDEETAAYILTLDAINFGSGYVPELKAEGWQMIEGSIYYTVSTRLKQRFETQGMFSAESLTQITSDDCAVLLGLDPAGKFSAEFSSLCTESLRALGDTVQKTADGSFFTFVQQAKGSAEKMVRALLQMNHYRDECVYGGLRVAFYKRAQITAADLNLAFRTDTQPLFNDIARLTMFADNAVPHVLRVDGVLEYSPALAAKIDSGEDIPAGSAEEVEIRACAAQAVELIAAAKKMPAVDIDHILWHRSVEIRRYSAQKPHRTKTLYY